MSNKHPYNTRMTSQSNSKMMNNVPVSTHEMISVARKEDIPSNKHPFAQIPSRSQGMSSEPLRMSSKIKTNSRSKGKQSTNQSNSVQPIDFSTIRTTYPHQDEVKSKRLYNLPEGKTFYPTWTEFQDPYEYIASITKEGSRYGIIKIIPPEGWNPNFSLETTVKSSHLIKQKVNTMEGETRAKLNYIEQLQLFHAQQGRPFSRLPQLDKAPIDLHKLARAVADRGGPHEVSKNKQWAEVAREIKEGGYSQTCTSASKTIKERYFDFIDPYEKYISEAKRECKLGKLDIKVDLAKPEDVCGKCGKLTEGNEDVLHCDGECEKPYHIDCLNVKKENLNPDAQWHCPMCLFLTGTDYGFEPGEGFTLRDLQQTADSFRQRHLKNHPVPPEVSMEDHIESEFWRLAHSMDDNTEVFYGADINSTDYGSERDRDDPYNRDPWNLRNLPRLTGSLLHDITPAIPGMMLPWVYVGMIFSAFCWHVEDHYTYSINYMHWGETKTWYGISASYASKFEAAAKKLLPELFQHQPDLLTQLTTILNPEKLVQEGVEVFAIDQRPNQFLNCNEAVNFALPDWIKFGCESIKFYKEIKRHQDKSSNLYIDNSSTLTWFGYSIVRKIVFFYQRLKDPLSEMCTKELKLRTEVIQNLTLPAPIHDITEPKDSEMVCSYCNGFSYFSALKFKCTDQILCIEHADYAPGMCNCGEENEKKYCYLMQVRIRDFHLKSLMDTMEYTVQQAQQDIEYFSTYLEESTTLSVKVLEDIYIRVKECGYDFELSELGHFIEQSEIWFRRLIEMCFEVAQNIWPSTYRNTLINNFDVGDFICKWEKRTRSCLSTTDIPPLNQKHYCFCRRPDNFKTMIECDKCHEWYHCECIGMSDDEANSLDTWTCSMCHYDKNQLSKKIRKAMNKFEKLLKATTVFPFSPRHSEQFVKIIQIIKSLLGPDLFHTRRAIGLGLAIPIDGIETKEGIDTDVIMTDNY
ncbi:1934_t:CDS:2 [Dentiscutata erythropus]|uniref:1934_t:CDS:1 n=1 Tax=Dentiscutata erythropus TaxID=1348616 RepID=A0A9N9BFI4_9GLOM|nr:1934_t:CDS:2 [Dentiscutata erythropus]